MFHSHYTTNDGIEISHYRAPCLRDYHARAGRAVALTCVIQLTERNLSTRMPGDWPSGEPQERRRVAASGLLGDLGYHDGSGAVLSEQLYQFEHETGD